MTWRANLRATLLVVAALATVVVAYPLDRDQDEMPTAVVARLQEGLLESMTLGASTDWSERFELLEPVVDSTHDVEFVARSILRKYWDDLGESERERFAEMFRRLCIGTYADKFDAYSGEHFEQLDQRTLKRGSILVRTRLVRPGKDDKSLEYVLSERTGQWRIVNIVADGVSDLALKRAEYGSVMDKEGLEGLLARLEKKIADMAS